MCGDLKPGETAAQLVLHFTTNQSSARIPINTRLEHVVEWRLTDYSIVAPNGGAAVPNMWRFQLDSSLQEFETNNVGGIGFAVTINSPTLTWAHFDNPRVVSKANVGYLNTLQCSITAGGLPATFTEATFHITVVMKPTKFIPQQYVLDDRQTPNFPSLQYDTRANI